jgi:hypothetical protein
MANRQYPRTLFTLKVEIPLAGISVIDCTGIFLEELNKFTKPSARNTVMYVNPVL